MPLARMSLARLPLARSGLIVISKSGTTAETLTQFLTLLPEFEAKVGKAVDPFTDDLPLVTDAVGLVVSATGGRVLPRMV